MHNNFSRLSLPVSLSLFSFCRWWWGREEGSLHVFMYLYNERERARRLLLLLPFFLPSSSSSSSHACFRCNRLFFFFFPFHYRFWKKNKTTCFFSWCKNVFHIWWRKYKNWLSFITERKTNERKGTMQKKPNDVGMLFDKNRIVFRWQSKMQGMCLFIFLWNKFLTRKKNLFSIEFDWQKNKDN